MILGDGRGDMAGHKKWNRFDNSKSAKVEFHPNLSKTVRPVARPVPQKLTGPVPDIKFLEGRNLIISKGPPKKSQKKSAPEIKVVEDQNQPIPQKTGKVHPKTQKNKKVKRIIVDKLGLRWPKNN